MMNEDMYKMNGTEEEKPVIDIKEYLMGKYPMEKRQAINDEMNANRPNFASALAGFGAAQAGGNFAQGQNAVLENAAQPYKQKLMAFDQGRESEIANYRLGQEDEQAQRSRTKFDREEKDAAEKQRREALANDPMSPDNQKMEASLGMIFKNHPQMAASIKGMNAQQRAQVLPILMKQLENEQQLQLANTKATSDAEAKSTAAAAAAAEKAKRDAERLEDKTDKKTEREFGLTTPYGLANTVQDAKDVKEAYISKRNFDSKLSELIALRKEFGGESLDRNAVARGKQLSKDLLLEYKNMAKLGVLSSSDKDIIEAIIPEDPLEYNASDIFPGADDPIMHKLTKFKADNEQDFANTVKTRTRGGVVVPTSGPQDGQIKDINGEKWIWRNGQWEANDELAGGL